MAGIRDLYCRGQVIEDGYLIDSVPAKKAAVNQFGDVLRRRTDLRVEAQDTRVANGHSTTAARARGDAVGCAGRLSGARTASAAAENERGAGAAGGRDAGR